MLIMESRFQESRLDTHDDPLRFQRTHHTSIPIDSNIGKYKPHSHSSAQRPVVKDLISQYYPPDSTLNIISTGKKRAPATNAVPRSHSRDAPTRYASSNSEPTHAHCSRSVKKYTLIEVRRQTGRWGRARSIVSPLLFSDVEILSVEDELIYAFGDWRIVLLLGMFCVINQNVFRWNCTLLKPKINKSIESIDIPMVTVPSCLPSRDSLSFIPVVVLFVGGAPETVSF